MDNKKLLRKTLDENEFLVLPGVYDCLSAKLAEKAGAKTVFLSGGALSVANLGKPDIGFLNLAEFSNTIEKITSTIDIPLISDADNGFGNAIHVGNTAKTFESLGLCGMQVDDQVLPQTTPTTNKEALSWALTAPKIKAIRKNVSEDFIIIFRTITNMTDGVDEAINRINRAKELGADYAYVDGIKSKEELEIVAKKSKIKLLINMNEKGVAANLPIEDIKKLGYRIGLYPVSTMAIAAKSMYDMLCDLIEDEHTLKHRDKMFNPVEVYNMMGLSTLTEEYLKMYDG
ncbi:MAG TPA: isocitrate lyase/phosphoenolpyruvate mutase family protein [Tissierellales bacterium]|nr:isocitrate lyase/phosphoenolpyruvate mutase family protein [Tissierellales bacterium]